MASVFGHGIVGYTLSKVIDNKNTKWLVVMATISAILPDLDVIGFHFGIHYESPLGHRGLTHSIVFAILWSLVLMFTLGKNHKALWFWVIFLSTLSHGLLDAMTSGGRGVGFFIPFNNERFFLPFRGIKVSPLGIENFFTEWGIQVIFSEFKYIFLPCFLIFGFKMLLKPNKS